MSPRAISLGPTAAASVQNGSFLHAVESYLSYFASGAGHTARAKRLDLQRFTAFLHEFRGYARAEKLKVRDWDLSSVQSFVDDSLARGESPATVARRLATIKHMGRTLAEKVPGFINPAREVKGPKIPSLRPKGLSRPELRDVRERAVARRKVKDSFIRHRNEVLFEFMIDTGLRADEVRLLRLAQLDEKLEWITSVRTKGRRYRNVYITSAMRPRLKQYLEARALELKRFFPQLPKSRDGKLPLFISTYGAEAARPESFLMGSKTLWRAVHELSAGKDLHPHLLRHSYALDLLDESNDVRLVAQALGHSDVRITMRYTERTDREVAAALEKSRRKKSA